MRARMEPLLILVFVLGVGALSLSIASRRAAERSGPSPVRSPNRPTQPARPTDAKGAAVEAAAPEASILAAPAPSSPASIPEPAHAERRKHPRIRSDQNFMITPFAGRALMAQCCDVSAGGMLFRVMGCTLRAGDLVRVSFNIGTETVAAIGSVLRVRGLDPVTTEVSLEFVRLDPWAAQLLVQALEAEA
jgi:hypothetical protein